MPTVAYESDTDRISLDDVQEKTVLARFENGLVIENFALTLIPLPKNLGKIVWEFILEPILILMDPGDPICFWPGNLLTSMNLVALDMSLHPPVEVFSSFGLQAFWKGCFDSSYMTEDGGIYYITNENIRFRPCWENPEDQEYVCALASELVLNE